MPTLTAQFVARVQPDSKPRRYTDGNRSNGLALQVQPSGSKQWIQRLTVNGKRREFGLGGFPAISLAQARDLALERKAAVVQERTRSRLYQPADQIAAAPLAAAIAANLSNALAPQAAAEPRRCNAATFGELADKYRALHLDDWKPNTLRNWDSTRKLAQALESTPVDTIKSADVIAVLDPLYRAGKTTAGAAKRLVYNVLNLALSLEQIDSNPADARIDAALTKGRVRIQHHTGLSYQNAPRMYAKLCAEKPTANSLALRLVMLTVQRLDNVRTATFDQFNPARAVWQIPAEATKTGKPYSVPLSDEALSVLEQAQRQSTSRYLFPSKLKADRPVSAIALRDAWMKHAPIGARIHGLRSDFRTWVAETTDYPSEVAEYQLGHRVGTATEQAYQRSTLYPKRVALMRQWEAYLASSSV